MQRVAKKATAIVATAAAIGFSSLFLAAAPASAAPVTCGNGATMLTGGICELTVTATGTTVFTPTAEVSKLEALLVAGGGTGDVSNQGYGAGGGGEVKVVGFADTVTPINLQVGAADIATRATQGTVIEAATAGISPRSTNGGASGNGNVGSAGVSGVGVGAGGGAGGAAPDQATGGAGATAASVAPAGSLFAGDTTCYGGGGASASAPATAGTASCGGGFVTFTGAAFAPTAPTANSGGGGSAGGNSTGSEAAGASGVVVLRWAAVGATVTFDTAGRGTAAPQTVAFGTTVTRPADPAAAGFTFNGWFADAAFTTPVDFSAPVNASTTYYASFTAVAVPTPTSTPTSTSTSTSTPTTGLLAATGGTVDTTALAAGLAAMTAGLGLLLVARRRTRRAR